jgi:hypothetical protein
MMNASRKTRSRRSQAWAALLSTLLIPLAACSSPRGTTANGPEAAAAAAADPVSDALPSGDRAHNMRLVGYHDLQGRQALEVKTKSDAANGNWAYVGHVPNSRTKEATINPITKQKEWNGTSIVEISDPSRPRLVWHIPNAVNANSRSVSVVYDYGFNSSPAGRDYLIRNSEAPDGDMKFQIFDITTRNTDPSKIVLVSEIHGTPTDSCGRGCGGRFADAPAPRAGGEYPPPRAHKGHWSQKTGLFFSAANEPGFHSTLLQIWDLKDPRTPKFVGRAWLPGQKIGEPGFQDQYAHHPIVDDESNRLYAGFREGSGQLGAWDISDPANPKLVWSYDTAPPGRGPHTVSPIRYDTVPNFEGDALPRTYAFVTDELGEECGHGVKSKSYMFDITHESHPMPVSTFQVPIGDFCKSGGDFGPHQHAEHRNSELNRFEDKLAWIAYLNAGIRVVDLSDPYHLTEVGYYIPKVNIKATPNQAIQLTDVDLDHRGLAYATDRDAPSCLAPDGTMLKGDKGQPCVGTGLFILEYTGKRK